MKAWKVHPGMVASLFTSEIHASISQRFLLLFGQGFSIVDWTIIDIVAESFLGRAETESLVCAALPFTLKTVF